MNTRPTWPGPEGPFSAPDRASDSARLRGREPSSYEAPCSAPARCYCRVCRPELHARRTDPVTSHQAAARAADLALSHRNLIAAALDVPRTPKEIAARTGLEYHAVQRRLKEMTEHPAIIEPTGAVRDGCREWRRRA